jgi:hypothetical protein
MGCKAENGACEPGEGCACSDCLGKQDSCARGAICDQETELCRPVLCPIGTALCNDGTCSKDCYLTDSGPAGCVAYGTDGCDVGEGCACKDCAGEQDSCVEVAVCNYATKLCRSSGKVGSGSTRYDTEAGKDPCDNDGDGFESISCGGDDCNDKLFFANPDGDERCNSVDDDCDGKVDEGCDDDSDDYCDENMVFDSLMKSKVCSQKGDCDDEDWEINPGKEDVCDGLDNNCDGKVDSGDCEYKVDVSYFAKTQPRVLDVFTLEIEVENKQEYPINDLSLKFELPSGWQTETIPKIATLPAGGKKSVQVDVLIPDYELTEAKLKVKVLSSSQKTIAEQVIDLSIDIPEFLVTWEPRFNDDYDQAGAFYMLDFYYVINNRGKPKMENLDLEFNVNQPSVMTSTPIADYISDFDVEAGDILVLKLPSSPYGIKAGVSYEVVGYLYQSQGLFTPITTKHVSSESLRID